MDQNKICWICKRNETTAEHKIKKSDLSDVFGNPTQIDPLYYNGIISGKRRQNYRISSLNSKHLKFPPNICADCNNSRTQPHDLAWQHLSKELRTHNLGTQKNAVIRTNRIFTYDTRQEMLNVHLYFIKLFGCIIVGNNIPININELATAILNNKANPFVFIKFYNDLSNRKEIAAYSDLKIIQGGFDDLRIFAEWNYHINNLIVNVIYANENHIMNELRLRGGWHPSYDTTKLTISTFNTRGNI